jgi:hypothetical protein
VGRSFAPVPMHLYFPMRNITTRAGPLTFAPVYTISLREADTARATADLARVTTVVSLGTFREAGSLQSIHPAAYFGDHFGDHTLCAVMNDPRVCARIARPQIGHTLAVTSGNVLPLLLGVKWSQVQIPSARLENIASELGQLV